MGIIAHDTTLSSHISSRCGAPANFDQNDPQSFNLYSYVENNPLSGIDPNGRNVTICTWINHSDGSMSQSCQTINGDAYKAALDAQMIANSKNSPYNGVQAPGGDRPNGIITCDGQACGTVSWSPDPSPDEGQAIPTMFPMDVIAFGGGAKLGSDIVDAFVGLGAEDAGRTVIGRV